MRERVTLTPSAMGTMILRIDGKHAGVVKGEFAELIRKGLEIVLSRQIDPTFNRGA